jgi:hypothetical protein
MKLTGLGALLVCAAAACARGVESATEASAISDLEGPVLDSGPSLLDQASWRPYDPALDPLRAHQPDPIDCDVAGWFVEFGELEVDTGHCNYLLVEHPALRSLPAGSRVELELRHFDLNAPEVATAHVALLFADEVQWQTQVAVPGPASVAIVEFTSTRSLEQGDPIRLHLHNHGQNTWTFAYLRVR